MDQVAELGAQVGAVRVVLLHARPTEVGPIAAPAGGGAARPEAVAARARSASLCSAHVFARVCVREAGAIVVLIELRGRQLLLLAHVLPVAVANLVARPAEVGAGAAPARERAALAQAMASSARGASLLAALVLAGIGVLQAVAKIFLVNNRSLGMHAIVLKLAGVHGVDDLSSADVDWFERGALGRRQA